MSTALVPIEAGSLAAPSPVRTANPVRSYLASLVSPASRKRMLNALRKVARLVTRCAALCKCERCDPTALPWHELGRDHVHEIRARLAEAESPGTANLSLVAVRRVLRECWRAGLMSADAYQAAADVGAIKGETLPAGRMLSTGEVKRLFRACSGPTATRDRAIFAVARVGLRRAELVGLEVTDYDGQRVRVRHGKGRKQREVPLPAHLAANVDAWVQERGEGPGALFWASNGRGRGMSQRRISSSAVFALCRRAARRAGIPAFTPHDLRRTFASELFAANVDGPTIQRAMGHASLVTTARYDRRPDDAIADAVALLA